MIEIPSRTPLSAKNRRSVDNQPRAVRSENQQASATLHRLYHSCLQILVQGGLQGAQCQLDLATSTPEPVVPTPDAEDLTLVAPEFALDAEYDGGMSPANRSVG